MRITQNMIYDRSLLYMNSSLSRLAELQEQYSTEKKINRPSDDPSGYYEARQLSTSIRELQQYSDNVDTATAWLNLADSTLISASTVLTSIEELAQQASTGTLTDDDRENVAVQVRELFEQLITLANTSYEGDSIFAGQKTDGDAFVQVLYATVEDETLGQDAIVSVSGDSDASMLVQFTDDGTIGGATDIGYRYSTDGGATWTDKTLTAGDDELDLDGVKVTLASGSAVTATTDDADGTSITVRPTAMYMGDDEDGAEVRSFGATGIAAEAEGSFSGNVLVRIDSNASLSGTISYSYSQDGGTTWKEGNTSDSASLSVPGGFLNLSSNGGSALTAGTQFTIVPNTADIAVQVSPGGEVVVNNIGKDVFGGIYKASGSSSATQAMGYDENVFESVGKLIGCLETNDIDGVGDCLESLSSAHATLETASADVGAREIRLEFVQKNLDDLEDSQTTSLSNVEDADLSQLIIDLAKYQYIYESVLSVSSQIMGQSLLDYI